MRSPCLTEQVVPSSVVPYLRNKNLEMYPRRRTLSHRLWSRLFRYARAGHLRATLKHDVQVVISEQIVENAMVLTNIPSGTRTVLDFGGVESLLPLTFAGLGYHVTVWDQRPYPFAHSLLTTVRGDILHPDKARLGPFDLIVSVSTIEHLGLGSYGDMPMEDADERAVATLWSMVKPGGRLIATVPVGRATVHPGFRVYDRHRLRRVFPSGVLAHYFRKDARDGYWHRIDEDEVDAIEYEAPSQPLPVDAVAVLISDR